MDRIITCLIIKISEYYEHFFQAINAFRNFGKINSHYVPEKIIAFKF